jgi:hypothetical protein
MKSASGEQPIRVGTGNCVGSWVRGAGISNCPAGGCLQTQIPVCSCSTQYACLLSVCLSVCLPAVLTLDTIPAPTGDATDFRPHESPYHNTRRPIILYSRAKVCKPKRQACHGTTVMPTSRPWRHLSKRTRSGWQRHTARIRTDHLPQLPRH